MNEIFYIGVLRVKERIFNTILSDDGRSDVEKYDLLNNHLIHLFEFYFIDKSKRLNKSNYFTSNEIETENDGTLNRIKEDTKASIESVLNHHHQISIFNSTNLYQFHANNLEALVRVDFKYKLFLDIKPINHFDDEDGDDGVDDEKHDEKIKEYGKIRNDGGDRW